MKGQLIFCNQPQLDITEGNVLSIKIEIYAAFETVGKFYLCRYFRFSEAACTFMIYIIDVV